MDEPHRKGVANRSNPESCADASNFLMATAPSSIGKIAFVSPHCALDFTNGAATATLDTLKFLHTLGYACEVFCSSRLDSWEECLVEEILARRGVRYEVRANAKIGRHLGRLIFTSHGPVPVTLFNSASTRGAWNSPEEIAAFLSGCEIFLRRNRPDVVWTYGGDPVSLLLQKLVRQLGIRLVFALHNLTYQDTEPFRLADRVVVPTDYARQHYRRTLGLECCHLPLAVDAERVKVSGTLRVPLANGTRPASGCPVPDTVTDGTGTVPDTLGEHLAETNSPHPSPLPSSRMREAGEGTVGGAVPEGEGTCITFVNPTPLKGVFVFARVAEELSRRRPDIPLLVVEGSAKTKMLAALGIELRGIRSLRFMPNSHDPRAFLGRTKLLLMPSLLENAGLVAMEAMLNGIPVLASNRGALPETVGDAGFLFDIPAKYTPDTCELPTPEEVEPWVETIIRLWDNPAEYECRSQAARARAQHWHPDRLAPLYRDFFSGLTH